MTNATPSAAEPDAPTVEHLRCQGCDTNPTVARIDGSAVLVCHCTHVDGDLEPVSIAGFAGLPTRWTYERAGGPATTPEGAP